MDIAQSMREMAAAARSASIILARASAGVKNNFLEILSSLLLEREALILAANARDLARADESGMDAPRRDRLALNPGLVAEMAVACRQVAAMPDPVGATESQWRRPNGLLVGKMRIPLGVVAMIYEARPNVTIDASILCVKAGNAIILRGGSEARESCLALGGILQDALAAAGLPRQCAQVVDAPGREAVAALCKLDEFIDVMIPRGGEGLIRAVCAEAAMPVLKHYKGVCHAYVDAGADPEKACRIVENAKCQRPGVCNALECLLVNRDVAAEFLPMLARRLVARGVRARACPLSRPLLGACAEPLSESDLGREFHDLILAVRVVEDMDEAIRHMEKYGSRHTEIICTESYSRAMRFLREVDASMVAVNASTRFNDGGQLGLGAEIGISTSKLHAYGPMGVKELTTTKFVILGDGQIRE